MADYYSFSYKKGNSFFHKITPWKKLVIIPAVSIIFFTLPFYFSLALIFLQTLCCFALHFSIKEQFCDIKAVFYYGVFLYAASFIGNTSSLFSDFLSSEESFSFYSFIFIFKNGFINAFSNVQIASMLVKIFALMQSTSLLFKTSTSLELRSGIETIETFIRKILPVSKKNRFTNAVSLFITFIPMVFRIWNEIKRSWKARAGKKSLKMYGTLFTVLFSVGIKKAWNSARAIKARS